MNQLVRTTRTMRPIVRPPPEKPIIAVRGLTIGWGDVILQKDLSFDVERGEIFGILGGSGCGKSTLLRFLVGLEEPIAGAIDVAGNGLPDLTLGLPPFGVMFQAGALFGSLTVGENVALPLEEWTELPDDAVAPTVDSQMVQLQASGADTFFNITTPKFAAQAIRKAYDSGWKPTHYLNNVSNSIGSVLKPAGMDKSVGLLSTTYLKDPADPQWKDDPAIKEWAAFKDKYDLTGLPDQFTSYGMAVAQTLHQVLKQAGNNLTRENIMKEARNLKNFRPELLLPGIRINTSASDHAPIESEQLIRFDGEKWVRFGPIIGK
jgi:ABC-type sugar transport system ATPase subunit